MSPRFTRRAGTVRIVSAESNQPAARRIALVQLGTRATHYGPPARAPRSCTDYCRFEIAGCSRAGVHDSGHGQHGATPLRRAEALAPDQDPEHERPVGRLMGADLVRSPAETARRPAAGRARPHDARAHGAHSRSAGPGDALGPDAELDQPHPELRHSARGRRGEGARCPSGSRQADRRPRRPPRAATRSSPSSGRSPRSDRVRSSWPRLAGPPLGDRTRMRALHLCASRMRRKVAAISLVLEGPALSPLTPLPPTHTVVYEEQPTA
jgi:hypothetical protein